jgi:hypothetical protein
VPPASIRSHGECDARIKFPAVSDESGPACDEAYIQTPVILGSRYRPSLLDSSPLQAARLRMALGSWMKEECLGVRLVEVRSLGWGIAPVAFWPAHRCHSPRQGLQV